LKAITLDGFIEQPREWGTGTVRSMVPMKKPGKNGVNRDEYTLISITPDDPNRGRLRAIIDLRPRQSQSLRFYEVDHVQDGVAVLRICESFPLSVGKRVDYLLPADGEKRVWVIISSLFARDDHRRQRSAER